MGVITGDGTVVAGLGGALGFGETALPRGDDGFAAVDASAVFDQGFVLDGRTYAANTLFVSTDGLVTFGAGLGAMPADPASLTLPFLAIFMADIDTRLDGEGPESGQIWLDIDPVQDVVTITWDDVGFYRRDASATNRFQMQLFDRGHGAMDVVLRYDRMDWTTGALQGGLHGLGGTPAFIGYRAQAYGAPAVLAASGDGAAELALPGTLGNTGVAGLYVFRLGGPPVPIEGSAGNDTLRGTPGADILHGLAGDDWIVASGGADTIDGGTGHDMLDFSGAADAMVLNLARPTASTGWAAGLSLSGIEALIGTGHNDLLVCATTATWLDGWLGEDSILGNLGADTLSGNLGADTIHGGPGNDQVTGGPGDDSLYGDLGNDWLDGGTGADQIFGGLGLDLVDYANAPAGVQVDLSGLTANAGAAAGDRLFSIEILQGSIFADTLRGGAAAETLRGIDGDDLLIGNNGNDNLQGGTGNDTLSGGAGADVLAGGPDLDRVTYLGAPAAILLDLTTPTASTGWAAGDRLYSVEVIVATGWNDTVVGSALAETIFGGTGNDSLTAMGGGGLVSGDDGNDMLTGGTGVDQIYGGNGADTLYGNAADDLLVGGAGTDALAGGIGNDTLLGQADADRLFGNDGADWLQGDFGADTLTGGTGADTFFATGLAGSGADLVTDYSAAAGDVLGLGLSGCHATDFSVSYATRTGIGAAGVAEAFITLRATGEVLWIVQDGAAMPGGFLVQSPAEAPYWLI